MGDGVHAGRVEPAKEGFMGLCLPLNEIDRCFAGLIVNRFHALLGQRASVLDRLLADFAETWIDCGIIMVGGLASEHAAWAKVSFERWVFRVVGMFRLLLGVEVIEIAEELVETVHRRQKLIAVAEMVLAKLAGCIAERLSASAMVMSCGCRPRVAPGSPTLESPVRSVAWPVRNEDRPAVQLCSA
jgi:hypothetical protein